MKKSYGKKSASDNKELVKTLSEKLEAGVKDMFSSDKIQDYLSFIGKFHNYSANNALLIYLQKPEATLVAGYKTWQTEFNRNVRKGESAIRIFAPCKCKRKEIIQNPDGTEEEKEIITNFYKTASVFDISQTDGEPVPEICSTIDGAVENFDDIVSAVKNMTDCNIKFEDFTGDAYGYYRKDTNDIVVKESLPEAHKIKTLIHEIAHSILHRNGGEQADADRDTKEIQAESTAFIVCSALGVNTSNYSFEYVSSWAKDKGTEELTKNLMVIQKTANQILNELSSKLEIA